MNTIIYIYLYVRNNSTFLSQVSPSLIPLALMYATVHMQLQSPSYSVNLLSPRRLSVPMQSSPPPLAVSQIASFYILSFPTSEFLPHPVLSSTRLTGLCHGWPHCRLENHSLCSSATQHARHSSIQPESYWLLPFLVFRFPWRRSPKILSLQRPPPA